jgi:hypothetical protein
MLFSGKQASLEVGNFSFCFLSIFEIEVSDKISEDLTQKNILCNIYF